MDVYPELYGQQSFFFLPKDSSYGRDGGGYTVQKYARFYHYDEGGNILAETDSSGNIVSSFAYDPSGHPVAFTQDLGQETFFLHANARGDVVLITDEDMNWAKRLSCDPWGMITSESASSPQYEALSCPFAYAGYLYDRETGLYILPARCYSPALRRFLSKDPHAGSRANPLTLNPYQYCGNNPVNNVDPSGQSFFNFNFNFDFSGLTGMVSQLASTAALMQAGARGLAPFASSMSAMASSIHIGRMPSSSGIFSSFTASVRGFVNWILGQVIYRTVQSIQSNVFRGLEEINSTINPMLHPPQMSSSLLGSVWNGICAVGRALDKAVTGIVVTSDWVGSALQPLGVGYIISGCSSVLSAGQDLIHVVKGDMDWEGFTGRRVLDLESYAVPGIDVTNVIKNSSCG